MPGEHDTRQQYGTLFVVATPIGNLGDLTRRAAEILSRVSHIACEDTRRTGRLLKSLGVKKPLISYYQPREEERIPEVIGLLKSGEDVALVTDAGTPAISDPGYRLVRKAIRESIRVSPAPGPSALTAALSAAGLPTDRVTFTGFLPRKKGPRKRLLAELARRSDTLVFFESAGRLSRLLAECLELMGDREAMVAREMTKLFEESLSGTLSELLEEIEDMQIKGEVTVIIHGARGSGGAGEDELLAMLEEAIIKQRKSVSLAASQVAQETGLPRNMVYKKALEIARKDKD